MLLAEAGSVHELLQIVLQPGPSVSIGFEDVQQRVQHIGIRHSLCVLHALEPPDVVRCLLPQPAAHTQHSCAGSWLTSPPSLRGALAQHHLQPAPWPADTSLAARGSCAGCMMELQQDSLAASLQGQLVDSAIPLPLPSLRGGWRRRAVKVHDVVHVALICVHIFTKQAPALSHCLRTCRSQMGAGR